MRIKFTLEHPSPSCQFKIEWLLYLSLPWNIYKSPHQMGDPADDVRWQFRLFSWQEITLEGTGDNEGLRAFNLLGMSTLGIYKASRLQRRRSFFVCEVTAYLCFAGTIWIQPYLTEIQRLSQKIVCIIHLIQSVYMWLFVVQEIKKTFSQHNCAQPPKCLVLSVWQESSIKIRRCMLLNIVIHDHLCYTLSEKIKYFSLSIC